jgi:hypothetical protein
MNPDSNTYILQDIEIRLTGRTAERAALGGKNQVLVEVQPADEDHGTWKKWVPKATLFLVVQQRPKEIP